MTKHHSSTGPKSSAGKRISSKNALKNGATSQQLLNQEERQRFEQLCQRLRKDYPYKNTLIQEEIQRISKTTVQLERVQQIIDAEFEKSRSQSNSIEITTDLLKMSKAEKSLVAKSYWGHVDLAVLPNHDHSIGEEVIRLSLGAPIDLMEDLMQRAPLFCQYLFEQSEKQGIPIDLWLDRALTDSNLKWNKSESDVEEILRILNDKLYHKRPKELITALEAANPHKIASYANQLAGMYYQDLMLNKKMDDFIHLQPIIEKSAMPNIELMDHLMRYQTTLQNQLSKFIGELLNLVDREKVQAR